MGGAFFAQIEPPPVLFVSSPYSERSLETILPNFHRMA